MKFHSLKNIWLFLLSGFLILCNGISVADTSGVLIPLYVNPTSTVIQPILDAKSQHPSVPIRFILNPQAGVGTSKNTDYANAITTLQKAGIQVAGYVSTDYNTRPLTDVQSEINQWYSWYKPDGIFLAVMGAMPSYYQSLTTYIKSLGMTFSIGDAGMVVDTSYANLVDTVILADSSTLPVISNYTNWQNAHLPLSKVSFLIDNQAAFPSDFISQAKSFVGWFYLTNQNDANPWDAISPYFSQLVASLDSNTNTGKTGVMIPFYLNPTKSAIQPLIAVRNLYPNIPIRVILNPNSGPGSSKNTTYVNAIASLKAAGISVLGYVHTSYGSRSQTTVEQEIKQWVTWYQPDGIFFDEMGLNHPYYTAITAYSKNLGIKYVVGNPGTNIDVSAGKDVDVVTIFEDKSLPNLNQFQSWYNTYSPTKIALLSYSISSLPTSFVPQAAAHFGWIYITDDGADGNPWDELSTYFQNLVNLLNTL